MVLTDSIINYRRFLKRKNYSAGTVKNYMNSLKSFGSWINLPIESVENQDILEYIEFLLDKRLKSKTINNNLDSIRGFYNYLMDEEIGVKNNPVQKGYSLRLGKPLPKHLKDEQVRKILKVIKTIKLLKSPQNPSDQKI